MKTKTILISFKKPWSDPLLYMKLDMLSSFEVKSKIYIHRCIDDVIIESKPDITFEELIPQIICNLNAWLEMPFDAKEKNILSIISKEDYTQLFNTGTTSFTLVKIPDSYQIILEDTWHKLQIPIRDYIDSYKEFYDEPKTVQIKDLKLFNFYEEVILDEFITGDYPTRGIIKILTISKDDMLVVLWDENRYRKYNEQLEKLDPTTDEIYNLDPDLDDDIVIYHIEEGVPHTIHGSKVFILNEYDFQKKEKDGE